MIVEIDIPEAELREITVQATLRALQNILQRICQEKVQKMQSSLEQAVDVHLNKRLTDGDIKKMIESAVEQRIREALD